MIFILNLLISVIVCTHNRANILKMCLSSLEKQEQVDVNYEVIVIDNNSTDHTKHVCKPFLERNSNYRYVFEPETGLSNARNRGSKEARGAYVAYIDDDAIAYPDWLNKMKDFIESKPNSAAFGGPYEGFALVDIPEWFPPEYGTHSLGNEDKLVDMGKEWISGGNIVFKKSVILEQGGFNPVLGMNGKIIAYGEETRLLLDLKESGHQIYYASKMKVKHLIAEHKLSLWWLLKAQYKVYRLSYLTFSSKKSLLSILKSLVFNCFRFFIILFRPGSLPFRRRLYYSLKGIFAACGAMIEYVATIRDSILAFLKRKVNNCQ